MSKKTKKIYIFIKERVKKMDRDRFLDFLCKDAIKIYLDKNQYFSSINNHENTAYCLISGVCALLRFTQNGEEIIYHYFKEKDVIGGVPLFLSHKGASGIHSLYSFCSLYTKTRCELYKIPFYVIEQKIKEEPEIGYWISEGISRHFMEVISHIHSSKEDHTSGRLCRTLIELSDKKNGRYELQKYFTYTELARYLGVHSVTVSKIMLMLKKMGAIEEEGHQTIIRDMDLLHHLAEHPEDLVMA